MLLLSIINYLDRVRSRKVRAVHDRVNVESRWVSPGVKYLFLSSTSIPLSPTGSSVPRLKFVYVKVYVKFRND